MCYYRYEQSRVLWLCVCVCVCRAMCYYRYEQSRVLWLCVCVCAGECVTAGLHLSAEAGRLCPDGRHGVHHPVGGASGAGTVWNCPVPRLGSAGWQSPGPLQDGQQAHVSLLTWVFSNRQFSEGQFSDGKFCGGGFGDVYFLCVDWWREGNSVMWIGGGRAIQ